VVCVVLFADDGIGLKRCWSYLTKTGGSRFLGFASEWKAKKSKRSVRGVWYAMREGEAMKAIIQWVATICFVAAGVALLVMPAGAAVTNAAAFAPTRFTVVDQGTVGKPDVVMIPGLASSRAVWDAEAKLLAPNYRLHIVQVNGFAGAPAGANAAGEILPGVVEELHQYIKAGMMKPVVIGHSLGGC
jgi:hypothetical protein